MCISTTPYVYTCTMIHCFRHTFSSRATFPTCYLATAISWLLKVVEYIRDEYGPPGVGLRPVRWHQVHLLSLQVLCLLPNNNAGKIMNIDRCSITRSRGTTYSSMVLEKVQKLGSPVNLLQIRSGGTCCRFMENLALET